MTDPQHPVPHITLKADGSTSVTGMNRKSFATRDTFENFWARMGWGTGNINDASHYGFHPVTRNRMQLEWAYRGSWIAGKAIDAPPEDMTREGVELLGDMKPDAISKIEKQAKKLCVWQKFATALKWARLYGGAGCYIMIDGQKPETPLKLDSIAADQFKGLLPLDRWLVTPSLMNLVKEQGPDIGMPEFYDTVVDVNVGIPRMRIHHSRFIRFDGIELPYWQRITENMWNLSVLERLWDRLIAFDSVTTGAAQLVYKAHLRVIKIDGLREILATGGAAEGALTKHMQNIRGWQSNEHITLLDLKDEFNVSNYTFSGLDTVMLQFGQQLAGALDIPLVRLFGQSPAGLNATGESDMAIYRSGIKQRQETSLRRGTEIVYDLLHRSVLGKEPDEKFELEFKPIDQPTDDQRADITQKRSQAITDAYTAQIIDRPTALRELKNLARETGAFSTIDDELIEEALTEAEEAKANAPTPEEAGLMGQPGQPPTGRGPALAAARQQSVSTLRGLPAGNR